MARTNSMVEIRTDLMHMLATAFDTGIMPDWDDVATYVDAYNDIRSVGYADCLDHGYIRLIDWMGSDLSIVRNARQSFDAAWRAGQDEGSDARLIKYLMTHYHNTPVEAATVTFEVKAPIMVFRQWHRHRTQSYNEVSARYSVLPAEFYVPELAQITTQSTGNKQMRTDEVHPAAVVIQNIIRTSCQASRDNYNQLIALECPRELARGVLTVFTYSKMTATANLHNWFRFLAERMPLEAQYEIRVYAHRMIQMLYQLYPVATSVFIDTLGIHVEV